MNKTLKRALACVACIGIIFVVDYNVGETASSITAAVVGVAYMLGLRRLYDR